VDVEQSLTEALKVGSPESALEKVEGILGPEKFARYEEAFKQLLENGATVGDALGRFMNLAVERITPNNKIPMNDFKALMDAVGYDAVSFRGDAAGAPTDNRALFFNLDKLEAIGKSEAPHAEVPSIDAQTGKDLSDISADPQNKKGYNPEVVEQLKKSTELDDSKFKPEELPEEVAVQEAQARAWLEEHAAEGNAATAEEVKRIDTEYKRTTKTRKIAEKMANCMSSSAI
jgi:hypothetical protein